MKKETCENLLNLFANYEKFERFRILSNIERLVYKDEFGKKLSPSIGTETNPIDILKLIQIVFGEEWNIVQNSLYFKDELILSEIKSLNDIVTKIFIKNEFIEI